MVILAGLLFFFACYKLNDLTLKLAPLDIHLQKRSGQKLRFGVKGLIHGQNQCRVRTSDSSSSRVVLPMASLC